MRRRSLTVSPRAYSRIAWAALILLTAVVLTGSAVRLTDSGLGCPDWPQCHGGIIAPSDTHAWIEYGNRIFSALVGLSGLLAFVAAFRRRPYRRDLMLIAGLLPLGAAAQGALGALTVALELKPELVMSHFALSMLILVAAVWLVWRARPEFGRRPRSVGRLTTWSVRALASVAALTLFAGMVATAAGPHAGDPDSVDRLRWRGDWTMEWAISWHGYFGWALGLTAIAVWLVVWRRSRDRRLRQAVTLVPLLVGTQGLVGVIQYDLALPTELVWVHIGLATATWLAVIYAVAVAGRLAPRRPPGSLPRADRTALERDLEPVA